MSFINTLGLTPIRCRCREIGATYVFIEISHTFDSLGEKAMKNIRLLNLVCRDTSPLQRSHSKEINLLFWNGYTRHTSLDSSKVLLIEIPKISSGLWKLSLQIALVRFPFFKYRLYLQSLQYNHFFLHFHWYWRFIDTLFMVTWSAVTFYQFFAKIWVSLMEVYWESLSSEFFFH